jgi:two-component system, response regulator YesN
MIKVLVIDDDKLVRKGLISSMPWRVFDMEVVGEASNGENALEFLESHPVDLMMVDLAMPVMSGIELMRVVRQRYPGVYFVVLTFHQDFEYIQEALRLGAIDYIAKIQLEKEQFEEVLGRISERIRREGGRARAGAAPEPASAYSADEVLALISCAEEPESAWPGQAEIAALGLEEVGGGLWLAERAQPGADLLADAQLLEAARQRQQGGWALLRLSGVRGETRGALYRQLRAYRERDFFYDFDPAAPLLQKTLAEIGGRPGAGEEALQAIKEQWLGLRWVSKETLFAQLLADLKHARVPAYRLLPLMTSLQAELDRLCGAVARLHVPPVERARSWPELERWLVDLREQAHKVISRQPYSEGVVRGVLKAVRIVSDELDQPITAQDMARRVSMSRSYFSQCFRDITGRPFNDYLRHARIDRAKEYLLHTDLPIHTVAERTGYADEKYFSQVFREQAGLLPSEFRRREGRA